MRTRVGAAALALALGSLLILAAGPALADVVMPEPEGCPAGTRGATCHGGPHCRPVACASDGDCQGGAVCRDVAFCTGIVNCAGMLMPDEDPSQYDSVKVISACPASGSCASGGCETLKVCAAPASVPPIPGAGADPEGCAATTGGALGAWLGLLGLLALLGLARRQRQRAR